MARPRKEQDGPSALERMEEAFWEELEEKPYAKITVTDIVKKAQVNRNAFYYHHDDLDDLAHKAVSNLLLAGGANVIVELVGMEDRSTEE
ncbi:MAG: TetR family transcriptional regulator, partial [Coriobacteriaceae bacterium]|nr:TetR family transcriptional regulator [Coriobacteriaceae bacterium]